VTREAAGQLTVLSKDEELLIVERLVLQGEWGFPLTTTDLRNIIKNYLDSQGRTTSFVENRPGPDFVYISKILAVSRLYTVTYQYDTPPHNLTPHKVLPHNNTPKGRALLCGGHR
jgi:hypothetical protein